MTRDELLDWAIASGRILPQHRDAWELAFACDPAKAVADLRATSPTVEQPTGRLAEIARDTFGGPNYG